MNRPDYTLGLDAQIACLWEVTARKPGNVHRFKDFEDTTYLDFTISAGIISGVIADAAHYPVGVTIADCLRYTVSRVGRNTNLGIVLLFAPLARAATAPNYQANVERVLSELTLADTECTYYAIRVSLIGGLGEVKEEDVYQQPTVPLREAMALAAHRDTIALQYTNGFREVFDDAAPAILVGIERTGSIEGGIIHAHLHLMSRYPDTLIARKRGVQEAEESAQLAQWVLDLGWPHSSEARTEFAALDGWLRAEGNSRNPGTTADLIAAALFVLLRQRKLGLPLRVPWAMPSALLP
jgi:triphosphoribosyl-dephospho-CoA synthase